MNANEQTTGSKGAPEDPWQRFQDWLYVNTDLGFYLDLSRMNLAAGIIDTLKPQFDRAFAAMAELESGAIANPDEQRMVGHYWLRRPELAPDEELGNAIRDDIGRVKEFARSVLDGVTASPSGDPFRHVLVLGIGGSALGPQFVADALAPVNPPLSIAFLDNTDPDGFDRVLTGLGDELAVTLVIVISKSGGTAETRNAMIETAAAYAALGLDFAGHAVAVTQPDSKLDRLAVEQGWLGRFAMYDWIGGRTSETSVVGLLPAALQNIDIDGLLAGAATMDEATRVAEVRNNPAALLALAWYSAGAGRGAKDMVILPYKDRLLLFSRYLQQLIMESLGKALDLDGNRVQQGLAVYGNKGSTDQHAYVQQLREGIDNFFVTFVEVLRDRSGSEVWVEDGVTAGDHLSGFFQGTRAALAENGRESLTITVDELSARSIGALIALFERAVGFYAALVNINAYHQPGVEAGKLAASAVLDLQRKICGWLEANPSPLGIADLAQRLAAEPETVYLTLRHLAANRRDIMLDGDLKQPAGLMVRREANGD